MGKNTFFLTGLKSECLSISKNIHENTINVSTILEHCESIISDTINQQMDKNMQRAEKKRNSWSKTSNNFAIKCLYSTGEWSRYFNKKTGVYALNELRRAIALLKELQGKIGIIRNFAEIISSSAFIVMNFSDQKRAIHQYWSRHDQSKEKLMRDIQNFQELINILDRFCEFVPPEIKSYLQLNFQVLKEAQKLFKIVEKYADYIDKLSQETQNSITNIWNTKKTIAGASLFITSSQANLDLILDNLLKTK